MCHYIQLAARVSMLLYHYYAIKILCLSRFIGIVNSNYKLLLLLLFIYTECPSLYSSCYDNIHFHYNRFRVALQTADK